MDLFLAKQKGFAPQFRDMIEAAIDADEMNPGEAIIAGVDELGGHIFTVEPPGWERPWNSTGFAAIGIGAEHAELVFLGSQYTQNRPWQQALAITFFAKKRAEISSGVGPNTDLYYIFNTGYRYFEPAGEYIKMLDDKVASLLGIEELAILDAAKTIDEMFAKEQQNAQQQQPPTVQGEEAVEAQGDDEEGLSGSPEEGESEG